MPSEAVPIIHARSRTNLETRIRALSPSALSRFERALWRGQTAAAPDAIPRRAVRDTAPLSFAQERLWFLEQLSPEDAAYHVALLIPLNDVSIPVLKRCLYDLTRRHESLRSTIGLYRGEPVQHIHEPFVPPLTERDLSGLSSAKRTEAWRAFSALETTTPFDLTRGPLWRCCLYRLNERDFVLQCVMHHIISDVWSLQILERDIHSILAAYGRFEATPLMTLPIQFADYAAWQREEAAKHGYKEDLEYWRGQLQGAPPLLELPFRTSRPARATAAGASLYFTVSAETLKVVKTLCEREATTPFTFFLSVFKLLIAKYTDRDDIVVGVPVAGRKRAEVASLIGFFVNTLVLRSHVQRTLPFCALLRQLRETSLAAQSHQDIPFEKLVSSLTPKRALDHNPLFQIAFSLETGIEVAPAGASFGTNLDASAFAVSQLLEGVHDSRAKFDLSLQMVAGTHGISGVCEYRTELYETEAIADFIRRFLRLAEICATSPDTQLSELTIAEEAECIATAVTSSDLSPWAKELPDGLLQASVRDRDGLALPPGASGRLYLRRSADLDWVPSSFAAIQRFDGKLECLGPLTQQVLINGRRLNLAVLTEQLRNSCPVTALTLSALREKGGHDAVLITATAEKPGATWQSIVTAVRGLYPWLVSDLRCRVRLTDGNDGEWVETAEREDSEAAPTVSASATEVAILGAFLRVLGIEEAEPEDNFFDLGGDSLRALRLVGEIKAHFGVEIPLMVFFENPTATALAVMVNDLQSQVEIWHGGIDPTSATHDVAPLSYGQEQIWLAYQMNRSAAVYNVPFMIPLKRPVQTKYLQRALDEVLRRHDVLRSTFFLQGTAPVQVASDTAKVVIEIEDLSDLSPEKRWDAERSAVEAEATRSFDLENGPILRARLFRFGPADHALMLTLHHIACDGQSAEILRHEILTLYDAFEASLPSPLPKLTRQYRDYCLAQRARFTPALRQTLLRHWNKVLEGAPLVLDLPFARERSAVRSNRGRVLEFELPKDVCQAVHRLAASENATVVMVLLTCFKVLLYRYTGIDTLVVGTAVTDRATEEDKNLIGYFANTVVLCTRLDGNISFREALARVRRTQLDAYDHQGLPFEILAEEHAAQRVAAYHPIFQIMFAFQPGWNRANTAPVFGERHYDERILEVSGTGTAKFDLTLALTSQDDRFLGAVEYTCELFPRAAIERMIQHFRILARSAMEYPDWAISDLTYFNAMPQLQTDQTANTDADAAPAWLRRTAGLAPGERIGLLAAPDSPAFQLGSSLASAVAAKSFDARETGDWSSAVIFADADSLSALSLTGNNARPRRILCFGIRLPNSVRRTWPTEWLNLVTLFHACPLHWPAAWIAESATAADIVWHFPEGVQSFIADVHGRPIAPGVTGLIIAPQVGSSSVRAQYLEDGRFRILGHAGRCLFLRGRMVDLDTLETRLCSHPGLNDAAVIAIRDGDKPVSLSAYLNPSSTTPTPADLIRHLRAASPTGVVPDRFYNVAHPLPRDPWGLIDEARLLCTDVLAMPYETTAQVNPSTPRQAALRELWEVLLGSPEIGLEDNFFDLGGSSLIAVQILGRIRAMYGTEIGIGDFFATPTLAGLDAFIEEAPVLQPTERGPALVPVQRDPPPALSFAQERLWFLDQFQPETPLYNTAEILPLGTDPDLSAIQRALDTLTVRHEVLRTSFANFGGTPAQLVHPPGPTTLKIAPITAYTQATLDQTISAEIWRPFNLETGPLFRATLLRPSGGETLLLLTLHHIITDAWSMQIIKNEFLALYRAISTGQSISLPHLSLQYADYAVWERCRLRGARLDALMAYWRRELENAPALLELPTDRPRPAHQSFAGAARTIRTSRDVVERLRALARERNTTPFVTYLAAFAALLHRLSGQADLVIGTPVANRERPELEQVCGFFANTIVIRSRTEPEEHFTQMLDRISATLVKALSHAEIPFEKLVEELQPHRDPSHNPVFQVMFVHDDHRNESSVSAHGESDASQNTSTAVANHHTAKFDFLLQVVEDGDGLLTVAEYSTALFNCETVARWLDYYHRILCAVAVAPDSEVASIPLVPHEEMAALTAISRAYTETQNGPDLLHLLLEAQAARTPDALALEDAKEKLSFSALDRSAETLAETLAVRGVGPGIPVGIYLERSVDFAVAVLGVMKAGGACLVLDPKYPQERLSLMIEDAHPLVILADAPPAWLSECTDCLPVRVDTPIEGGARRLRPGPEDPVYLVYTSGSTGRPKGVVMPHRALTNLITWQLRRSGLPSPRTLQLASLSFDVAFQEMFATWSGGGSLVFITETERRDPAAILARIESARIERIYLPYVTLDQLAQEIRRRGHPPTHLHTVITAGEALKITPDIAAWFAAAPHCRLINQYGPSETHIVTEETLEGPVSTWPVLPSIGRPIDGTAVFIVDERLQPVPPGITGEIVIAGKALATGYLNQPEETAARFVHLPENGAAIYRSGDLGRLSGRGRIEFLGRRDQQLKVRGFRIEPGEIETALKHIPGIADAVVIARGEHATERYLVGYVVPHSGSAENFDPEPVLAELRRTLPEHMRPGVLIAVPQIPLTPSGKHDRAALSRMTAPTVRAKIGCAPRTPLERRIAAIWHDVLGREAIGVTENFFELGGHSLSATRLVSQIGEAFQIDLPVRTVFDASSIEALSREIVLCMSRKQTRTDNSVTT